MSNIELIENLGPLNILRIPLAAVQFTPNIRQKIEQEEVSIRQHYLRLYSSYAPEEIVRLLAQLQWASQNPSYNFQAILPGIKASNVDILFYFAFLVPILEQIHSAQTQQNESIS